MKLVVKIGGSMIFDDCGIKTEYVNALLPVLEQVKKKNQMILSIGGGAYVKNYENRAINFMKKEIVQESSIHILRANVVLFSNLLKMRPIFSLEDVKKNTTGVIGGIAPGRSTDANAAACAAKIKADLFIKLTNVNGIYDKDPRRFRGAKLLKKIKFSELQRVLGKKDKNDYKLLDVLAQKTIMKNKIKTVIANGDKPNNILKIISGEDVGTVICK